MKIRIGNDFVFNWAIERGGLPEDLSSVLEKHLHLSVFGKRVELIEGVDYDITGNVIRIEVTPAIANILGTYKAEFHYILPDNGLIDDERKCAVDVDAFQIVAKTAQADDSTEFSMTSDMAIAFKGDKGDSAYQVWLEQGNTGTKYDYFAYLRQPAIDAGASISELEGEIQVSEGLRVQAESERETAESLRVDAELLRQSNTQEAISNAEDATENANTAAQNADDAREAIQDDLALKANHGYESNPKTLKEVDDDLVQLAGEVNQKANKTQEAWITPTLLGGWVAFSQALATAQYFKDSLGMVHLRGIVKGGTSYIIFNLPVGYRPSATVYIPIVSNAAFGYLTIGKAGTVGVQIYSSEWVSLENIIFKAEQ